MSVSHVNNFKLVIAYRCQLINMRQVDFNLGKSS